MNNSLFVGGPPMNNSLFVGGPPMNNSLSVGGSPTNKSLFVGGYLLFIGVALTHNAVLLSIRDQTVTLVARKLPFRVSRFYVCRLRNYPCSAAKDELYGCVNLVPRGSTLRASPR